MTGRDATSDSTASAPVPPEFEQSMTTGWLDAARLPVERLAVAEFAARRRAKVSDSFPGTTVVAPAGPLVVRANDTHYPFRAAADTTWLAGWTEPEAVLVMVPAGGGHDAVLLVRARADMSTGEFWRDRQRGELWMGPVPSLADIETMTGIETRPLDDLESLLSQAGADGAGVALLDGIDGDVDARVRRAVTTDPALASDVRRATASLRLVKDEWELAEIEAAVAATARGFDDVVAELRTAPDERWLEGTFFRRARHEGYDVVYASIVACCDHATCLHWSRNDGPVRPGDLALLDMGVEMPSHYTADVCRTLPISGTFTTDQRAVYDAVMEAQGVAIAAVRRGSVYTAAHEASTEVLARHLVDWGVLTTSVDEALASQLHRRYTLHSTSHVVGLEVHDCMPVLGAYRAGAFEPGMVLTIEPGLYFQRNDATVPESLRGIGVRVEDDVVVTADGRRVLSSAIPSRAEAVEAWVRGDRRASPPELTAAPRDAAGTVTR